MTIAERPEPRPANEPGPADKIKSMGEALDGLGFKPPDPPRRIVVREEHAQEPLTRWRKPRERD